MNRMDVMTGQADFDADVMAEAVDLIEEFRMCHLPSWRPVSNGGPMLTTTDLIAP